MVEAGHDVSIFFYNPNIHPKREYEIRKEENKRYAADLGIPFVDADYDTEEWYRRARGMEFDPERGGRCSMVRARAAGLGLGLGIGLGLVVFGLP